MREFVGFAFNHIYCVDCETGELTPRVEAVLMSSEPKWVSDVGGLRTQRELIEHRFLASAKGLRLMAETCSKQADALDKLGAVVDAVKAPIGEIT